jgi:glyoxylase-like metal-dependent hydrolase (beta-lactamase superfamily II)
MAGVGQLVSLVGEEFYVEQGDAPQLRHQPQEVQEALGMRCEGLKAFKTVSDGEVLSIGPFEVKVMATPGHTQGSVCYLISEGGNTALASGDTLFSQSVGRTDLPGGNWNQLLRSLEKLATLPDDLLVLPGHGPDTTIGRERRSNPFWP